MKIAVCALDAARWRGIVESLVGLLRGELPERVMRVVTAPGEGLFPAPAEIERSCSCPDWASMCKHVAAVLYGVGARLDREPELLFRLRAVDPSELAQAASIGRGAVEIAEERRIEERELSAIFGIAIEDEGE